jgi:hypothetical protein
MRFSVSFSRGAYVAAGLIMGVSLLPATVALAKPSAEFCAFVSSLRHKSCSAKVQCGDAARKEVLKDMVCSCLNGEIAPSGGQSFAPKESRRQVACCVAGAIVHTPSLCDGS